MKQLGTKNMGAYLRKMAIDGYIIKVDYTQQKKLAAAVSDVYKRQQEGCSTVLKRCFILLRRLSVLSRL